MPSHMVGVPVKPNADWGLQLTSPTVVGDPFIPGVYYDITSALRMRFIYIRRVNEMGPADSEEVSTSANWQPVGLPDPNHKFLHSREHLCWFITLARTRWINKAISKVIYHTRIRSVVINFPGESIRAAHKVERRHVLLVRRATLGRAQHGDGRRPPPSPCTCIRSRVTSKSCTCTQSIREDTVVETERIYHRHRQLALKERLTA